MGPRPMSFSEREPDVSLDVPRRLIRVDGAEARLVRPNTIRQNLAGRGIVRQIQRRDRIRRAVQRERRLTTRDLRAVRRVEHVGAQLQHAGAAQPDVPGDREIEHAREAPLQIVVARLEPHAADKRPLERRRVELAIRVAAAPFTLIPDDADAAAEIGRAGQVHVVAAVLVAVGDRIRRARQPRPDRRQLPVG